MRRLTISTVAVLALILMAVRPQGQSAGPPVPQTTQIPFFIAAADYTIIGDEYYAASAYISREPTLLGSMIGQDISKALIFFSILIGVVLLTLGDLGVPGLSGENFFVKWFKI